MHIHVRLTDAHDGPWIAASALTADGRLMAYAQGSCKTDALEILEVRLIAMYSKPVTFHIEDECEDIPHVRILVEDVAICGVFIATAFDASNVEVAKGECCCCEGAINQCLIDTVKTLGARSLHFDVEVMNPNADDESECDGR